MVPIYYRQKNAFSRQITLFCKNKKTNVKSENCFHEFSFLVGFRLLCETLFIKAHRRCIKCQ